MIRAGRRAAALLTAALGLQLAVRSAAAEDGVRLRHRPAPRYVEGQRIVIEGLMEPASDVDRAELFYRTSEGAAFKIADFDLASAAHYRVELPPEASQGEFLEYYVVAIDFLGARHDAFASAAAPQRVPVVGAKGDDGQTTSEDRGPATEEREPTTVFPEPKTENREPVDTASPSALVLPAPSGSERRPPGAIVRIERPAIEASGARTLADLLLAVPELEVVRDVLGFATLVGRAIGARGDVLLIIDGVPADEPLARRVLVDLPAELIDAVEVARGAAMRWDDTTALVTTVHVETRREASARLTAAAGHTLSHLRSSRADGYGTYRLALSAPWSRGAISGGGALAFHANDGARSEIERDGGAREAWGSLAPGPLDDEVMRLAASGGLRWTLDASTHATLDAAYALEDRGAWIGNAVALAPDGRVRWHMLTSRAAFHARVGDGTQLAVWARLRVHDVSERLQLRPAGFLLADRDGDGDPERFAGGVRERYAVRGVSADLGAEATMDLGVADTLRAGAALGLVPALSTTLRRNIGPSGLTRAMGDVGALLDPDAGVSAPSFVLWLDNTYEVSATLRLIASARLASVRAFDDVSADSASARLAGEWTISEALAASLSVSRTTRPPTLRERADVSAASLPAPLRDARGVGVASLDAPALHTLEIDLAHGATDGDLRYDSSLGVYGQELRDGVVELLDDEGWTLKQRGLVRQLGAWAQTSITFSEQATLTAGAAWNRQFERAPALVEAVLVTSQPQLGGFVALDLPVGPAELHLVARYRAERRNDVRTLAERDAAWRIPADLRVDASLRTRPVRGLSFTLEAHNLLDAERRDPVPLPGLIPGQLPLEGFSVLAGLQWSDS